MDQIYYNLLKEEILKLLDLSINFTSKIAHDKRKIFINKLENNVNTFTNDWFNKLKNKNNVSYEEVLIYYNKLPQSQFTIGQELFIRYLLELNKLTPKLINFKDPDLSIFNKYPKYIEQITSDKIIIPEKRKNLPVESGIQGNCRIGIINPSVQCWLNTGLQMLISIPEVRYVFKNLNISNIKKLIKIDEDDYKFITKLREFRFLFTNSIEIRNIKENFIKLQDNYDQKIIILSFKKLIDTILTSTTEIDLKLIKIGSENISDIFYKFFEASPREQDDVEKILKIINLFDNSMVSGLFKIMTHFSIEGKLILSRFYIQEKENNSVQFNVDKYLNNIIRFHDDSRYIFFFTPIYSIDLNIGGNLRSKYSTNIESSIIINKIKFNLFGACIYDSESERGTYGHYVYQLYYADGTFNILALYNDDSYTPNPPTSYLDINKYAQIVIYQRAD